MIRELYRAPSKAARIRILRSASNMWQVALLYAYNGTKYGVKGWDHDIARVGKPTQELFELLDKLATRQLTGHSAEVAIAKHTHAHGTLIHFILSKSFKCGVGVGLVKEALPGLLATFAVQLAKDTPLRDIALPATVETKYDGVRIIIKCKQGKVTFWTRNNKQVMLPRTAALLAPMPDAVIDCEVVIAEGRSEHRTNVAGMINSAMHGGVVDEGALRFMAFDYLTIAQFESQQRSPVLEQRKALLTRWCLDLPLHAPITVSPSRIVVDHATLEEAFESILAQGFEGLIVKQNVSYAFKRTSAWAKLKAVKTADLRCYGILAGQGKYGGNIGALSCSGIVEGFAVEVNVGSGLTDSDRIRPASSYIGKTVEVKYNAVIPNASGTGYTLFLPRFVTIRTDK